DFLGGRRFRRVLPGLVNGAAGRDPRVAVGPRRVVAPLRAGVVLVARHELLAQQQGVGRAVRDVGDADRADGNPTVDVARVARVVHVARHDGAVPGARFVRRTPGGPGVAGVIFEDDGADHDRRPAGRAAVNVDGRAADLGGGRQVEDIALLDVRQDL